VVLVRAGEEHALVAGAAVDDAAAVLVGCVERDAANRRAGLGLHLRLAGLVAAPVAAEEPRARLQARGELVERLDAAGAAVAVLPGALVELVVQRVERGGDGLGDAVERDGLLLAVVAPDQHALAVLDVARADLEPDRHAAHLPLVELPAR